jgi:5'-methylthioadenosine phosphorylase
MTLYPECILAREAQLCYASISMVTDYDVWADKPVTAADVSDTMRKNVEAAKRLVLHVIDSLPETRMCDCSKALSTAMI